MEEDYKGHTIKALARQLLEPQLWQPIPEILTREENGSDRIHLLSSAKYFAAREEAESEGLAIAKRWIDDAKPSLF